MVLIAYATREGLDEPVQPRSLARAFTVRTHKLWKQMKGLTKQSDIKPHWIAAHAPLKINFTEDKTFYLSIDRSIDRSIYLSVLLYGLTDILSRVALSC